MKFNIISLKGLEFDGEVNSINLKTSSGEITILDNHRPIITSLLPGKLRVIKKDGETLVYDVRSGVLEVGYNNLVTALIS